MWRRVSSVPDYRWPDRWMSVWLAPWRWLLAGVFRIAHLVGALTAGAPGNSIVVIRTDGIGDAILFEPALASLKRKFPDHQLVVWAPAPICDLLREHPAISELKTVPRGAKAGNLLYFGSLRWRAIMGWRLGRNRFDLAIYAVESPEPLANWILRSVRAREKWYVPGDLENQFEWQRERTNKCADKLLQPLGGSHELTRIAHLASQWGQTTSLLPRIDASTADARWLAKCWPTLARSTGAEQIIGIMAGSATTVNAYPIESWAEVVSLLWRRQRSLCIFFGALEDSDRIAHITQRLGDVPYSRLPQKMNLRTTIALLPFLDGFISMDTGLAHAAVAQNVPTVVLCNGGHPGRFFPWPGRTSSIVLNHPMPCEGCLCRCVLSEPECVTRISPEEICDAYLHLRRTAAIAA
jgi:ADP-heptose:LPS heptosyltransferase